METPTPSDETEAARSAQKPPLDPNWLDVDKFDVILVGTGLMQSIVAAALARNGKTVLHLDCNGYYGGEEANFTLADLEQKLTAASPSAPASFTLSNSPNSSLSPAASDLLALRCENHALSDAQLISPASDALRAASRNFSIDISPRLILSGEPAVDTLVQSGVYRYLEFKSVEGLLVRSLAGPLVPVPHSRADVFASKLSLKEKHSLMQCLKACAEPATAAAPLPSLFVDWLRARGLSDELQRAVLFGVCRLPSPAAAAACPCDQGLSRMRAHIASVGKFGSVSPLLFPLYGTSELAQAFCRLAAVRGAVYVLKRAPSHLCLDPATGRCTGVVAAGQRLYAPVVMLPPDALPEHMLAPASASVARAIIVTTAPLVAELPPRALAVMPPMAAGNLGSVVHVLQLDSSMSVCPKDHYVIHFTSAGSEGTFGDLKAVMDQYLGSEGAPKPLWQCTFVQQCREPAGALPSGLEVSRHLAHDWPSFSGVLDRARQLFERLCPGAPFLPPLPDPDQPAAVPAQDDTPAEPPADPSAST